LSVLAELYLHLDLRLSHKDKAASQRYLEQRVGELAYHLFRQRPQLDIRIEDGSVKVWLSVAGAVYLAIGQYGSFRSGVDQIIEDGKLLKAMVVSDLKKGGLNEEQILEDKRLIATPDRIRRLLLRIDRFEQSRKNLSVDAREKELAGIIRAVTALLQEMAGEEKDCELLLGALPRCYHPLPEQLPATKALPSRREEDYPASPFS